MLYEIVAFLLGLVLVVKGGDLFVGASLAIAKLLRIARLGKKIDRPLQSRANALHRLHVLARE